MKAKRIVAITTIITFIAIAIIVFFSTTIYTISYSDVDLTLIAFNSVEFDEDCMAAYDLLLNADTFSHGSVGYGGQTPDEIYAWGKLLICKNAKDIFIQLEREATIEGKMYALCGLYYLDYENYNTYISKYINSSANIYTLDGCIGIEKSVNELIKIDGAIYLKGINDTLIKWMNRNHINEGFIDFYGGAIPHSVLDCSKLGLHEIEKYGIKIFGFEIEF